ncbi:ribonuclease P protein subunit [Candidatus Micrarchaeota archaeon]|nr:ribonuclease P protein subunit [Candidatus Micrarchaeota archaeon]
MMIMKTDKASLLMGELIGESVEVVKSTQRAQIGVRGVVIDEALKTLVIETKNGEKIIAKTGAEFKINGVIIAGKDIMFRPEDRIKKYWRKFDAIMRRR